MSPVRWRAVIATQVWSADSKSVPVVGLKSALASLNTITIPKEELDVSGARANIVKTIDLNDYLPEEFPWLEGQFRDHGDTLRWSS